MDIAAFVLWWIDEARVRCVRRPMSTFLSIFIEHFFEIHFFFVCYSKLAVYWLLADCENFW